MSEVNVLMVGGGKAGSWQIRGAQLGNAIGARTVSAPTKADWEWADVAVLVKRAGPAHAIAAQHYGVPVVWDALDFWSQPYENGAAEPEAKRLLFSQQQTVGAVATIGATKAMAEAAEWGGGSEYLPHHSWRGLTPQAPRADVKVVTYQGNPVYLGQWRSMLVSACQARGWSFAFAPDEAGPEPLWQSDILVSFRDGPWDGWMCREWKSGVKLVNAQAAGRPIISQPSAAMREIDPPGWTVETKEALDQAFDVLARKEARDMAYEACLVRARSYTLPAIAERFRGILTRVQASCATT